MDAPHLAQKRPSTGAPQLAQKAILSSNSKTLYPNPIRMRNILQYSAAYIQ
jgi:hypothetical protein